MTGDVFDTVDAEFAMEGLKLRAQEPGIDRINEFTFFALRKTTEGDVLLFAHPEGMMWQRGTPQPEWFFYCGDPNTGSQERRREFADATRTIRLSDRD